MSITLVDYGRGNLRSVAKALEHCGASVHVTGDPREVAAADKLVVPGVGAFGDCMASLDRLGLSDVIRRHIGQRKLFLGICLGLQVLFETSEESPGIQGLSVFKGRAVKFIPSASGEKIPHMGWNTLRVIQAGHPLFAGISPNAALYFVHSYYIVPEEETLRAATADYAGDFCAAIATDRLFACQFHPEKSQEVGLTILRNFVRWK